MTPETEMKAMTTGNTMTDDRKALIEQLRTAQQEIAAEGHAGWGNAIQLAIDELSAQPSPDAAQGGECGEVVACHDCALPYGAPGWIEAVIPHAIWKEISPSKDEGGILCVCCISKRLAAIGRSNVPVWFCGMEPLLAQPGDPKDSPLFSARESETVGPGAPYHISISGSEHAKVFPQDGITDPVAFADFLDDRLNPRPPANAVSSVQDEETREALNDVLADMRQRAHDMECLKSTPQVEKWLARLRKHIAALSRLASK